MQNSVGSLDKIGFLNILNSDISYVPPLNSVLVRISSLFGLLPKSGEWCDAFSYSSEATCHFNVKKFILKNLFTKEERNFS